ncbi:carboxymuconolactone decarboxylase family protein [Litorilinea aerophila]|uniref:Carboxymuconolactone decarboxylase family protein n=1 Tax=Litorilinea aerophila TaxID=1204385 RepID=A0A540VID7_9CHLR|nr:carboxymuconolactone decarboxylase family protein [Litorilinea aerophila]MCC9076093.1 carboxymuconolactone decarboxylase family protein [Litorilinea aerophila]OUC06222.1 carboxymuconolactone decarboxylase [Litorilinea aerophila]
MPPRIDYAHVAPEGIRTLHALERYLATSTIERPLRELVNLRASLINGCAYCIDMHTKDARAAGESEQRLYALAAWHEAPFYTERERAALAWTDAVTRVSETHVPDTLFAEVRRHFSEQELVDLTLAVVAINGWNRLSISFRPEVDSYQPRAVAISK